MQAFRHNLKLVRRQIRTNALLHRRDSEIMAVIKADAYGHDLSAVMPALLKEGIRRFAVASLGEALEARAISRQARILVLGGTFDWKKRDLEIVKKNRLELAINSLQGLKVLARETSIPLHLKLDTGMNRLGIKPNEWGPSLDLLQKRRVSLAGIFTHYASPDRMALRSQALLFEEAVRWFWSEGIRPDWVHSENSASLFTKASVKKGILSEVGNLVRPGISLYGYLSHGVANKAGLKPVLELVSQVGLVKSIEKGETLSYDCLYRASRSHDYGVVPIGYADGLSKAYSDCLKPRWQSPNGRNKGVLSILGAVCMDMIMVGAAKGQLKPNDRVVLWGRFPNPMLKQNLVGPYELNLRISKRIPRIWVK